MEYTFSRFSTEEGFVGFTLIEPGVVEVECVKVLVVQLQIECVIARPGQDVVHHVSSIIKIYHFVHHFVTSHLEQPCS